MARQKAGTEFARIARIERLLSGAPAPGVEVGIGDDAAVLRARGPLVWSIDAQVEGVHFERRWLPGDAIGYRSFMAATSDLAAMGARPVAALSNLALPARFGEGELTALVEGQARAAKQARCPIIGGNLSRASELSITTSVLGTAARPLLRSTARPGDELWLLGEVGLAAAGLAALRRRTRPRGAAVERCIEAWRWPRARLDAGARLALCAHAAIDVSDGLAGDAAHIARASQVCIAIDAAKLRAALAPELGRAAALLGLDPLELALFGGEDYALLATGPRARRPRAARPIGLVERGQGVCIDDTGARRALGASFDHFAPSRRKVSGSRAASPRRAGPR